MYDNLYRFIIDARCHLADGTTTMLRSLAIVIEAEDERAARSCVASIAEETVHEAGDRLLDAPLDHLDVVRCRADPLR